MSSARIKMMFGLLPFRETFSFGLQDTRKMELESNKMIFTDRCFFKGIKMNLHNRKRLLNITKNFRQSFWQESQIGNLAKLGFMQYLERQI